MRAAEGSRRGEAGCGRPEDVLLGFPWFFMFHSFSVSSTRARRIVFLSPVRTIRPTIRATMWDVVQRAALDGALFGDDSSERALVGRSGVVISGGRMATWRKPTKCGEKSGADVWGSFAGPPDLVMPAICLQGGSIRLPRHTNLSRLGVVPLCGTEN